MQTHLKEKIDSSARLTLTRFPLIKSEYNNGNILYHWEKVGYYPLKQHFFLTKEAFKSGKNQIQVGHVNIFGPGYTEDGLLLQFKKW